ncbi:hypothetical protein [Amorphus orientalis]|uniref:Uncharacterized protein n=1 Tax=Amorphus orientalis TaxID=649198 RepID=A0AAE3VTA7_9HYPH|nr:hypothetical protein [Amorphus orientalis]MDQ0317768.1 hypothetical protein [Amorphus orientalis]
MGVDLKTTYGWHRQNGKAAREAIERARRDVIDGASRYPSRGGVINPPFKLGSRTLRWIEKPSAAGLRFVGYADDVCRSIRHTGWFTDNDQSETVRGVVYRIPARNGVECFVAGYDNDINGSADADGPACIEFDVTDEEYTAARWADGLAEMIAERERDHSSAWSAGLRVAENRAEIADMRETVKALLAERREIRATVDPVKVPTICASLKERVSRLLDDIRDKREENERLADGDHVDDGCPGFYSGDESLRASFAEGLGAS